MNLSVACTLLYRSYLQYLNTYLCLYLVSLARLSHPKRESLVKAVLCSCTMQPYLDALHFDQQSCMFSGPQFLYQTALHLPYHECNRGCVAMHWSCSVGLLHAQLLDIEHL